MWTFMIIQVFSCVLRDSYNTLIEESANYETDPPRAEDNYEMHSEEQATKLQTDLLKFHELHKLANREYNKALRNPVSVIEVYKIANTKTTEKNCIIAATIKTSSEPNHTQNKTNTVIDNEYDYYDLINEHYGEAFATTNSNTTYHAKDICGPEYGFKYSLKKICSLDIRTHNCTEEEMKRIGLKAIVCLWNDYMTRRISQKVFVTLFWKIAKIWCLVYIAIAVPLWCTRGWCCCCLICKFFKPRQTIEEAKKYLLEQPPGVLKTKVGYIHYEPSVDERESYEEFEHFISTL